MLQVIMLLNSDVRNAYFRMMSPLYEWDSRQYRLYIKSVQNTAYDITDWPSRWLPPIRKPSNML